MVTDKIDMARHGVVISSFNRDMLKDCRIGVSFGIIICITLVGLLVWRNGNSSGPVLKGKSLAENLRGFLGDGDPYIGFDPPYDPVLTFQPSPERTQAWKAVESAGTNAIPYLLELAGSTETKFSRSAKNILERIPRLGLDFDTAFERNTQAVWGFVVLGRRGLGESAIPSLLELLKSERTARTAMFCLHYLQARSVETVEGLEEVVGTMGSDQQIVAMTILGNMGTNAFSVTPTLLRQFRNSTNQNVSATAAVSVTKIGIRSKEFGAELKEKLLSVAGQPASNSDSYKRLAWAADELEGRLEQDNAPEPPPSDTRSEVSDTTDTKR